MSIVSTEQGSIAIPKSQPSSLSKKTRRRLLVIAGRILLLLVACLIWELVASQRWMNPVFIGRPSQIIVDYGRAITGSVLLVDARATVVATLLGFALATIAGIACAMLLTQVTILDEIVQPFFTALNSMPRVALAPLFVLW